MAARAAAVDAAEWLVTLQHAPVRPAPILLDAGGVRTWTRELSGCMPSERARIARLEDAMLRELAEPIREEVPSRRFSCDEHFRSRPRANHRYRSG